MKLECECAHQGIGRDNSLVILLCLDLFIALRVKFDRHRSSPIEKLTAATEFLNGLVAARGLNAVNVHRLGLAAISLRTAC